MVSTAAMLESWGSLQVVSVDGKTDVSPLKAILDGGSFSIDVATLREAEEKKDDAAFTVRRTNNHHHSDCDCNCCVNDECKPMKECRR